MLGFLSFWMLMQNCNNTRCRQTKQCCHCNKCNMSMSKPRCSCNV